MTSVREIVCQRTNAGLWIGEFLASTVKCIANYFSVTAEHSDNTTCLADNHFKVTLETSLSHNVDVERVVALLLNNISVKDCSFSPLHTQTTDFLSHAHQFAFQQDDGHKQLQSYVQPPRSPPASSNTMARQMFTDVRQCFQTAMMRIVM